MFDNRKPIPRSILIFGPSSRIGDPLATYVRDNAPGIRLRLSTSTPAKAEQLRKKFPEAEIVFANFGDPASLRSAVDGMEGIFLVTPDPTDEKVAMGNVAAAIKDAGCAVHVIRLLALQPEANNHRLPPGLRDVSFMPTEHPVAKKLLDESGLPVTYLNSGATYLDNLLRMAPGLRANRTLIWPERLIPFIDPREIGEIAARLLLSDDHRHIGQFHTMNNGQDILRFSEVAQIMSEVWGEQIAHDSSKESFFKWYADRGDHYLNLLWEFFIYEEDNNVVWARNDFMERILGRKPMNVRRWLAEHGEAILGVPADNDLRLVGQARQVNASPDILIHGADMTTSNGVFSQEPQPNFPRNCWWVAGFSGEIGRTPIDRFILDRPVLLYRKENGEAVAMDNRCPHRWAPLSLGKLVGDAIECPYHGITFGPDGTCVNIPSQKTVQDGCKVHSYPLVEAGPFVWIWMGDPDRIGEVAPPVPLDWAVAADWTCSFDQMEMAGNYMQLHENVMDLTHFGFIHRDSLDVTDWITPPKVTTDEATVTFRQEFENRRLPLFHATAIGSEPDRLASRFVTEGNWVTPAIHLASETAEFDGESIGGKNTFTMRIAHVTTPITMSRYRYFFVVGWDVVHSEEFREAMGAGVNAIFAEDKRVLEASHYLLKGDGRGADYPEIKLKADTPQLHARRKLAQWLQRD